jgi:hypothetical protein
MHAIFVAATALGVVGATTSADSGHLKFPAPANLARLSAANCDPCADVTSVPKSVLPWNPTYGPTPIWAGNTTVVWSSACLTSTYEAISSAQVPGLNATFLDVFQKFANGGCLMSVHGGAVRDLVLGVPVTDIDVE